MTYNETDTQTDEQAEEHALQILSQTEENNDISTATHGTELAVQTARDILGQLWVKATEAGDEATQEALVVLNNVITSMHVVNADIILALNHLRGTLHTIRSQRDSARFELKQLERDLDELVDERVAEAVDEVYMDPYYLEAREIDDWAERILDEGDITVYDELVTELDRKFKDAQMQAVNIANSSWQPSDPAETAPDEVEEESDEDDAA